MILNKKYTILEKIGNGKFGTVYKGINNKTNEVIAIKTENKNQPYRILKNETTILKYLYDHGSRNTPTIYWYGVDSINTYLIMSFYTISIHDYVIQKHLSQEKIDQFMCISIDIIETIHKNYIVHRDLKPQNFMYNEDEIFLIDFGLAAFYVNENTQHQTNLKSNHIIGTPKYISLNVHNGDTPSRRDDLISLGYIYLFLVSKELLWDSLRKTENHEQYEEHHILHYKNLQRKALKEWNSIEPICFSNNLKIHDYLEYCYKLGYDDQPNYDALTKLFE
jgi:serine/threonine protein kinase